MRDPAPSGLIFAGIAALALPLAGPRTAALMAANHTGDNGQFGRPARGMGFGLGVQVVEDPIAADLRQSKGTFAVMQAIVD